MGGGGAANQHPVGLIFASELIWPTLAHELGWRNVRSFCAGEDVRLGDAKVELRQPMVVVAGASTARRAGPMACGSPNVHGIRTGHV